MLTLAADQDWMKHTDTVAASQMTSMALTSVWLSKWRSTCFYHRWQTWYQYYLQKSDCSTNQLWSRRPWCHQYIAAHDNGSLWHHRSVLVKRLNKVENLCTEIHRRLRLGNLMWSWQLKELHLSTLVRNMVAPNNSVIQPTNSSSRGQSLNKSQCVIRTAIRLTILTSSMTLTISDAINKFDTKTKATMEAYPEKCQSRDYMREVDCPSSIYRCLPTQES